MIRLVVMPAMTSRSGTGAGSEYETTGASASNSAAHGRRQDAVFTFMADMSGFVVGRTVANEC